MEKKRIVAFVLVSFIILSLGLASASWFSDFYGKITGKAVSSELTEQWASDASGEYYNDNWKPEFATGASDAPCSSYKQKTAWCKKTLSSKG